MIFTSILLILFSLLISFKEAAGSGYSELYERDLFRLVPEPAPPPEPVPEQPVPPVVRERPPEPTIDQFLALHGVIVASPSLALIEDKRSGRVSIHEEGARLTGGRVTRVGQYSVIVTDESGREFELAMGTPDYPGLSAPPSNGSRAGMAVSSPAPARVSVPRFDRVPRETAPAPREEPAPVSLSGLSRDLAEAREDLARLQIMPVVRDGKVAGYRVANLSGRLAEMAAEHGLQDGDIVTGINRRPVTSLADIAGAYNSASPGSTIEVTILRGEREIDFSFTVDK